MKSRLYILPIICLLLVATVHSQGNNNENSDIISDLRLISFCSKGPYIITAASLKYLPTEANWKDPDTRKKYRNIVRKSPINYFAAGLSFPNYKHGVRIDHNSVSIDNNFAKTKVSRVLIEEYIKLRELYTNDFCNSEKLKQEWLDEIKKSPYYDELRLAQFSEHPKLNWKLWIIPEDVVIEGDGCKAFVTNISLQSEIEIVEAWLNLSNYNFDRNIREDLSVRLKNWKSLIKRDLNKDNVDQLINADPRFDSLRSTYHAFALAQWYKKVDSPKYVNHYLNYEYVEGLEFEIPYDQTFYENMLAKNQRTDHCDISGGILFDKIPITQKNISKLAQEVSTKAYITWKFDLGNDHYIGTPLGFAYPELSIIAQGYSTLSPMATQTMTTTVAVENEKGRLARNFFVAFFDEYLSPDGKNITYKLGEKFVEDLNGNEIMLYNLTWNISSPGEHRIYTIADYYNDLFEIHKLNNNNRDEDTVIYVESGYPLALINSPSENQIFVKNHTIIFWGWGIDPNEGHLIENNLNWTSNIDGLLGYGLNLEKNLSIGTHIISLAVKDSDNLTSIAQVPIHVVNDELDSIKNLTRPEPPIIAKKDNEIFIHPEIKGEIYQYQLDFGEWINIGNKTKILLPPLTEGLHTILVAVIDTNSLIGKANNLSFFVDKTEPSAPVLREELFGQDRWTNNPQPYITWNNPGDVGSGVDYYLLRIDDGNFTNIGRNLSTHPTLSTGKHTIDVIAVDRVGLYSNFVPLNIYVDITPPPSPKVKLTKSLLNELFVFKWGIPKDDVGISGYYYVIDKNKDTMPTPLSGEWTNNTDYMFTPIENDDFYFHIIAVDKLGNIGEVATHYHYKRGILQKLIDLIIQFFRK